MIDLAAIAAIDLRDPDIIRLIDEEFQHALLDMRQRASDALE